MFLSILLGAFFGYSFSASSFAQTAASEGGEMHAHFAQFQGPADVIQALSDDPIFRIVRGPDGKYYLGNTLAAPAALLGLAASPDTLQTNCTGTVLSGALKGLAGGVKGFVWDGWHALGGLVSNLALEPTIDLGFDIYSIATGTMTMRTFFDDWSRKHKGLLSVGSKLALYVMDQAENPSGDFAEIAEGFVETGFGAVSDELKHAGQQTQLALVAGARLLTNVWYDLRFGCPERQAQIIGRATFEVLTFYATLAKASSAARATHAAKVTETELLAKLAQESSVAEVRTAAAALLAHRAGAGGLWTTIDEVVAHPSVIKQLTDNTCGPACAQMILKDAGIDVFQSNLAAVYGRGLPNLASTPVELAAALRKFDPAHTYVSRRVPPALMDARIAEFSGSRPWIAMMEQPAEIKHWVVVDGLDSSGRLIIRDPFGEGSLYLMNKHEFKKWWNGICVK